MAFFTERLKKVAAGTLRFAASMIYGEETHRLKGELILKAYEGGVLVHEYRQSNIIVNTASILIARLLKDSSEPAAGITYLAVGSGNPSWTITDPPAPTTSQILLENEYYRKAIQLSTFVHPETGEPTTTDTNIVDYVTTFGEAEAVGPMLELALFGGDATAERNTGTMINWRTIPIISKTATMTLTIIFRITA
jgi:hypothetical protein